MFPHIYFQWQLLAIIKHTYGENEKRQGYLEEERINRSQ